MLFIVKIFKYGSRGTGAAVPGIWLQWQVRAVPSSGPPRGAAGLAWRELRARASRLAVLTRRETSVTYRVRLKLLVVMLSVRAVL